MDYQTVAVIGLGYIGLPTSAILATHGIQVVGVDVNPNVVATINQGRIHIVEPELEAVVSGVVASGRLRAVSRLEGADAFIIAVPTPFKDDHAPDVSYIEQAARSIAPHLRGGALVILESTSPVGTTEQLSRWLARERSDLRFPHQAAEAADVNVVYCPERVLPGHVLHELVYNDRIIGGITRRCAERAAILYNTFLKGQCFITDSRTAEMAKLSENAFRDANIAFANELAAIADVFDINPWNVIELANRHPRVNILQPGPGVGGHCIAVDPWFLVHGAPAQARLIRTAREINDAQPRQVVCKVKQRAARFSAPVIACLGLAYKADIDDLRESPAMEIVRELAEERTGTLLVVEPHIKELPGSLRDFPELTLANLSEACDKADIILLLVNHRQFKGVDRRLLLEKVVIDTRGFWR
ncbi:MAG: UDP-N-acetyl-D-mannosamine dehydrogenase [Acidobacteriia bacterium]|nr:UDP-N-acetyl-D-mannosamine dehydrogenase [Terriglobia bacterium]